MSAVGPKSHYGFMRRITVGVRGVQRDYQAMRDMYLTEPAGFDQILNTLSELDDRINGTRPQQNGGGAI